MIEKNTCGNCAAVGVVSDTNQIGVNIYVCRRYPPQPIVVGMTPQGPQIMSINPQVSNDTPACTEHLPKTLNSLTS